MSLRAQPAQWAKSSAAMLIALLVLRFPLLYLGGFGLVAEELTLVLYLCLTYLLTGLFLCLNRHLLALCHITPTALLLFLAAPLLALLGGNSFDPTLWVRLVMAAGFLLFFLLKDRECLRPRWGSTGRMLADTGIVLALCLLLPLAIHLIRGSPVITPTPGIAVAYDIPGNWLYQLSSAAISEEPLFRGLLWGWLSSRGMKDGKICLTLTLLFWAGHLYYIGSGVNFWIVHPLTSLALGLLVWRTRSITGTMALHASINTFADYLRHVPYL